MNYQFLLDPALYNQSMSEEKITIRLPNAREKLLTHFPQDNRGDIRIIIGQKMFKLQKAFLRLESGYFKKIFAQQTADMIEIKEPFNQQYFSNILHCFYGATIQLSRTEVLEYFPIIKFLQVQILLKSLRQDMVANAEQYDIFILMQIAHKYSEQEIFEVCLAQLEKEGFEQLRYSKHELLKCTEELFKMIIKTHNRFRTNGGKGLQFVQIDQLIKEFCEDKKLNELHYQELKFDLIEKNALSSQEYKQIFLDQAKKKKSGENRSMIKTSTQSSLFNSGFGGGKLLDAGKLTESVIEPLGKSDANQLTLNMEITFEKKLNQELRAQNTYLMNELNSLKESTAENKKINTSLQQTLANLKAALAQKEKQDRQQKVLINKLEKLMQQMRKELNQKSELIRKLEQKVNRLAKMQKKGKKYIANSSDEDEDQSNNTVASQIVPAHLLKDIAKQQQATVHQGQPVQPNSTVFAKKTSKSVQEGVVAQKVEEKQLDEEELEQLYSSRLQFDTQPLSIPKKLLPKLADFLYHDGFEKKKLTLIFKRSIVGSDKGVNSDLNGRNSLLILIKTKQNQLIGGFASIMLQKDSCDYLSDENAFIFSLTRNEKFPIKKTSISQAIFMSGDYLICFGNDLMLAANPLKENSECSWPMSYEMGSEKRGPKWLTGEEGSFGIKDIQVYEVEEAAMEMVL